MENLHVRHHLRTKIIAWSFIPTAIILSAVAWFTFYSYQKVIGDFAIRQDREIVQEKATQAVMAINNMIGPTLLQIFLEIDNKHQGSLEERAENILNHIQGKEIFDGGIYFLDKEGIVFKSLPARPELTGQDWSDTPQFRLLQVTNNGSVPTDLQMIGSSGKQVVCSAIAMLGQSGETVGVIYFCHQIIPADPKNTFFQLLNSQNLGPNVYLLDGNQKIIYSPDLTDIGKDLSGETFLQQLLKEKSQSGRYRIGSEDVVASYVPVITFPDASGWIVLKEQSWNEIMQPSLPYRQFLLVLLSLGLIVPTLVTAYGVRHITEPIQKLIRAAGQVTAGQFKQRIDVKTGDEIETLADEFNLMSAELDDSYSTLEKKVADRTRELAILNSIISVASYSLNIREILEEALDKTVEHLGLEAGAAFRLEAGSSAPLLMAHRGLEPSSADDLLKACRLASKAAPAGYPDKAVIISVDGLADENLKELLTRANIHSLVQIPLLAKARELGFFILGRQESEQPSPEELALLSSIGRQVGVAMENAHLYEQAEQAATAAERNRLARELHDAVTQTLFSANLIADVLPRVWQRDQDEGLKNLEELRQLTRGALAEMRTLLLEMRPESLERAGIRSLLTQLADAFVGRVRVPVNLSILGECEPSIEVKIAFYRIAQEALNNIAKHSGARQVDLRLECQPGQMDLRIRDDGLGFDLDTVPSGHLGIAIMRERAGSIGADLKIDSQADQGTTIELAWKLARRD